MSRDVRTAPPAAQRLPQRTTVHGEELVDDYAWLREKSSSAVLAHLDAENAWAAALTEETQPLADQLYQEMLGRIRQTDMNVPYRKNGWLYYSRTIEGKQYPIYARRRGTLEAPEEVLLDLNQLAEGKEFLSLGAMEVTDDGHLLAYSTDETGYREYQLHVKDLRTGTVLANIADKCGSVVWAADNRTLFYTIPNEAKRDYRLYRHLIGTHAHTLVFEEGDDLYDLYAGRSRSGDWIFVVSDSKTTSEVRVISAHEAAAAPSVIAPRIEEQKYFADHCGDRFYILTNDAGINYRVVTAPVSDPGRHNWTELVPYRPAVHIESIDLFRRHMVAMVRERGLSHLEVYDLAQGGVHRITFPEPAYAIFEGANEEFDTTAYRYNYQSFITPSSVYDYDMTTRQQTLLKRTEVLGGYDPARYRVERIFVKAADGAEIPVALVHRAELDPRGGNPLLLYGYGSYGASIPDSFNANRFSLIDRGMTWALAHIRGGGEMGKEWHEQGRMMSKKNTFTDFITVAEHLVRDGYTRADRLAIVGGSAGGLLVGAVANMRPDLFKAVLAYVPFVDVINTMLDASLPLTTQEYIEWGNPNEEEAYRYMKSYDPYSNIARQAYPAMLVRTSLNDSQVGYWEAAKWVAKLRTMKTDDSPLLLRVNLGAGHGGSSGRYDKLREDAEDYAWLLRILGMA